MKTNWRFRSCAAASGLLAFTLFLVLSRPVSSTPVRVVNGSMRDLGNVNAGAPFKERFRVRNVSGTELVIGKVHKSCTCFVAEVSRYRVPPGEYFEVVLGGQIPKENSRAIIQAAVSIVQPSEFSFSVTIGFKAVDKVSFVPPLLSSLAGPGEENNKIIKLSGWHEQISDLKLQFPVAVAASRQILTEETGQTWEVTLKHPETEGIANAEIEALSTNGARVAVLPIRLVTEFPVAIMPSSLLFRRSNADLRARSVTILSKSPYTIESIVCNDNILGVVPMPSTTETDSFIQQFDILPKERAVREMGIVSHKIQFNIAQNNQKMSLHLNVSIIDWSHTEEHPVR